MKKYVLNKAYRHWKAGETVRLRDNIAKALEADGVIGPEGTQREDSKLKTAREHAEDK